MDEPATPAAASEPVAAPAPAPAQTIVEPRSSAGRWLVLLILLALAGGAGFLLWQYDQQVGAALRAQQEQSAALTRQLAAVEGRAARLEEREGDLLTDTQRGAAQIAAFAKRIDEHDQIVGRLNQEMSGGHQRFQLGAVEQLLLLANDRVLLAHDPKSAITALEAADQRLGALDDPRLFTTREAVAQEKAALAAVAQPDLDAASLALASLIERVPRLPLAARVPERFLAPDGDDTTAPANATWWERAKASVLRALKGTFSVRRNRGPVPQLLSVDQESLVFQVLALRLEGARVALLRSDTAGLRELCESASKWIGEYFRKDDPGVLAAQAELERLQGLELSPPLPDISRSLTLLRVQLDAPAP
jgi:uroporphyrin-3 C-methyltransferase